MDALNAGLKAGIVADCAGDYLFEPVLGDQIGEDEEEKGEDGEYKLPFVVVVDEVLKAYAPATSKRLSVYVFLIVTNCIVLARVETVAMNQRVWPSFVDGIGNGLGYGLVLALVGAIRELVGAGTPEELAAGVGTSETLTLRTGAPLPEPNYGDQLQDRAVGSPRRCADRAAVHHRVAGGEIHRQTSQRG